MEARSEEWGFLDKRTGTTHDVMNRGENGEEAPGFFPGAQYVFFSHDIIRAK